MYTLHQSMLSTVKTSVTIALSIILVVVLACACFGCAGLVLITQITGGTD